MPERPVITHTLSLLRPLERVLASSISRSSRLTAPDRPIVILGAERSGTTLLYSLLANHGDLAWFSRLDTPAPTLPATVGLVRRAAARLGLDGRGYVAVQGEISRTRGVFPPSECIPYWRGLFGFGDEDDYRIADDALTADDLDAATAECVRRDLALRAAALGKPRLLLKQPGFSLKVGYLDRLLPTAIFIHSVRHPHGNLDSLVRAKRSSLERFWGIKIPGWRDLLDADPVTQAVLQLAAVDDAIGSAVAELGLESNSGPLADPAADSSIGPSVHSGDAPAAARSTGSSRYLRVRYEDLLAKPRAVMARLLGATGLPRAPAIDAAASTLKPARPTTRPQVPDAVAPILERLVRSYEERDGE